MKKWVDITTIDNSTPFSAVRWKQSLTLGGKDRWFSEVSGLETDGMAWLDGNSAALGYFGGHRMNTSQYTCSFHCDTLGIDTGLNKGQYQYAMKDAARKNYYDTTIQIGSETFYEVDFSLWDGWVDGTTNLYMPYGVNPFTPGEIYVYAGVEDIVIDKTRISFKSSGGTSTLVVEADDDWSAVQDGSWFTVSVLSGETGTTNITVTAPEYTSTTEDRTGTITFTCGEDTVVLNIKQRKVTSSSDTIRIGANSILGGYIGNIPLASVYMGENQIWTSAPFVGIKMGKINNFKASGGTNTIKVTADRD